MLFHKERQHQGWLCLLRAALHFCWLVGLIGACAVVPKHMQVDTGLHPKNQDKDVRFRTTYYFRVFDYCADKSNGGIKTPFAIDSLYRFQMTGKANSLTTRVNFESGTLTAGQIDPFGATVAFDKENGQFFFKTQEQVQQEAARERQFNELDRLVGKYQGLKEMLSKKHDKGLSPDDAQIVEQIVTDLEEIIAQKKETPAGMPSSEKLIGLQTKFNELKQILDSKPTSLSVDDHQLLASFRTTINNQINLINGLPGRASTLGDLEHLQATIQSLRDKINTKTSKSDDDKKLIKRLDSLQSDVFELQFKRLQQLKSQPQEKFADSYCQNPRRGFQILGPEGWRTFNQDERLIMAMNATGEPLIATMQELAGRVLDNQPIEAELLLPLIEEDLRITRAERELDYFSPDEPDQIVNILEKAIRAFTGKEVNE
jgi:hypothetical protein